MVTFRVPKRDPKRVPFGTLFGAFSAPALRMVVGAPGPTTIPRASLRIREQANRIIVDGKNETDLSVEYRGYPSLLAAC